MKKEYCYRSQCLELQQLPHLIFHPVNFHLSLSQHYLHVLDVLC